MRTTLRRLERAEGSRLARAGDIPPYGLDWVQRFMPHLISPHLSRLHLDLIADLSTLHLRRGSRENRIGPRGSGKTVWSTTCYATNVAMEGRERFVLILSGMDELAAGLLRDIRDEIEFNPRLAQAYPHAAGRGPVWRDNHIRLRNGCVIMARGVGGSIRGIKNRAARPTLVIGDDLNKDDDAFSPTNRRRKLDWWNKAVMNIGGPDTNVIVLGTAIHRQAVCYELYRGETAAAWNTKTYRSVIEWPARMDLWGEWEGLASNLADPDRLATARAFYDVHKAEMDRGAVVLWPAREPLYTLMLHRLAVGRAAFDSDKQDRPGTDGATEWPQEWFTDPDRLFEHWPHRLDRKLQTLDPSKGVTCRPGDYQAHVWGGIDLSTGTIYADAEFRREPMTDCIARAIERYLAFRPEVLEAEGNNTMGLLIPEFEKQVTARKVKVNYVEVTHHEHKLQRIRPGGNYFGHRHPVTGWQVRVKNTPGGRMLLEQLADVPNGEYDDGPDAWGTFMRRLELILNPNQ